MTVSLPVRVGAIGCGAALENLYQHPLRRLAKRGWLQVVALVEPSERRRSWAQQAFPGAHVGADGASVLAEASVDLTVITSPPPLHAAHAEVALSLGSHVLCEKPLADSVAAGNRMLAQARSKGRLLGVGMTRRFYPCLAETRRWLQEGRLGRVHSYIYREGSVYGWPVTSDAPFRRATSGGGVLLDKGVHVLDLLGWLFGPAQLVRCEDDAWKDGVEGNSMVRMDHNGVVGQVQLSWDQDLNNGFVICGDKGELMMPIGPLSDLFFRQAGAMWQRVPTLADWPIDLERTSKRRGQARSYYECIDYQLVQVLRALVHGEPLPVTGEDGLATLRWVEAAYGQSSCMPQPWLPAAERDLSVLNHWHFPRSSP